MCRFPLVPTAWSSTFVGFREYINIYALNQSCIDIFEADAVIPLFPVYVICCVFDRDRTDARMAIVQMGSVAEAIQTLLVGEISQDFLSPFPY